MLQPEAPTFLIGRKYNLACVSTTDGLYHPNDRLEHLCQYLPYGEAMVIASAYMVSRSAVEAVNLLSIIAPRCKGERDWSS